ncbi:MAG: hypothetical protein IKO80_03275 [Lachnospiraceae bacterium]|nr:hypothetical protein [Lachnospiraceae bacterium]
MKRNIVTRIIPAVAALLVAVALIPGPAAQAATTQKKDAHGHVIYEVETATDASGKEVKVAERHFNHETGAVTWETLYDDAGRITYRVHYQADGTKFIQVWDSKTNKLTAVYDIDEDHGEFSVYALGRYWFNAEKYNEFMKSLGVNGGGSGSTSAGSTSGAATHSPYVNVIWG